MEEDNMNTEDSVEDVQAIMNEQQAQENKKFESFLKKKLEDVERRLFRKHSTKTSLKDKVYMLMANKYPNLKKNLNNIDKILAANKTVKHMRTSTVSSVAPVAGYALLIVIGIIIIMALLIMITPKWLLELILGIKIEDKDGLNNIQNEFGISGKDFYGARVVYKDDAKATLSIVEDYIELVEAGVNKAQSITTIDKDGSTFDIDITINFTLPEDSYEFDEAKFASEYNKLNGIVLDVAKIVYKTDNAADYAGTSLIECVEGIKYFGYGETAMAEISTLITSQIVQSLTFVVDYPPVEEGETQPVVESTDVHNLITSKLLEIYTEDKYEQRTEKLFIKDMILNGDKSYLPAIEQENYVAFIFMPKNNVKFTNISFSVGGENVDNLTLKLTNNGKEIMIKKDTSDLGSEDISYFFYLTDGNLNESASKFEDIDESNLSALSAGVSLFDVVDNEEINYLTYLESITVDGAQYLTYKKNGVVVELSNDGKFAFAERETAWQA